MMIIDFNDQVNMQEKIFFNNKQEKENSFGNNIYYPIFRKDELERKQYRIGKFFEINCNENFMFKIKILLYTYTNHRILPIGSEDLYLKVSGNSSEMKKFHMYQNIHQSFIEKKIGNLNFDLTYKVDNFNYHQIVDERNISFKKLSVSKFIIKLLIKFINFILKEFQKFYKFEEEHKILYKIQERIQEENFNLNEKEKGEHDKKNINNYLSINDLEGKLII